MLQTSPYVNDIWKLTHVFLEYMSGIPLHDKDTSGGVKGMYQVAAVIFILQDLSNRMYSVLFLFSFNFFYLDTYYNICTYSCIGLIIVPKLNNIIKKATLHAVFCLHISIYKQVSSIQCKCMKYYTPFSLSRRKTQDELYYYF